MKAFVERFLTDEGYRANLQRRIMAGKAPHMEALLWQHLYGKPKDKVEDETPRRVATMVFLNGGRRDPMASLAPPKPIDVTPKTVRPSVALPEVSFDMEDVELPPPEGREGAVPL